MSEKAILVVSFGTSFPETRRKTIDAIESRTGFDFFANVPASLQSSAESQTYSFY